MTTVALGFLPKPMMIPVESLLPSTKLDARLVSSHKYRQIRESILEIGLIEPLSVSAVDRKNGQHLVLDGHLRLHVMKEIGLVEVPCLVATDDESFTYNNRVSRLSTIQEHLMIRRAIDRGISAGKLAKGLCIDVSLLQKKSTLLDGICAEVVEILKDRNFSTELSPVLRRMKPTRQVECAELMVAANSVTTSYARALLAATPPEMLVAGKKPLGVAALSQEQLVRMENEMSNVLAQYKVAEQSHGEEMLNLMLARGYIMKLMDNPRVMRYLQGNYAEILEEFSKIIQMTSIDA
ncbi:plasmid partitioning protein RepB C-terminal domain-containing protein [Variovorax sp. J31P207]|uniref:plasmid partitioning protein RepB C-terminal domain-containing protein n=1 Tax=Variovorax sp. J31P207 TaxID=3053510 RepID=UPI0025766FA6|nr:plasmid partitioning protein RepB C-terminal domain-containing protein [Variovorax sp. J31P207]MDM0068776.1 plasmid partitioning protein RepB C-terminal domain-containing protein [Variovorax sp. J31P207]